MDIIMFLFVCLFVGFRFGKFTNRVRQSCSRLSTRAMWRCAVYFFFVVFSSSIYPHWDGIINDSMFRTLIYSFLIFFLNTKQKNKIIHSNNFFCCSFFYCRCCCCCCIVFVVVVASILLVPFISISQNVYWWITFSRFTSFITMRAMHSIDISYGTQAVNVLWHETRWAYFENGKNGCWW